ncbi:GTP cyclohydrolase IIa [Vulcanisaeta thermophila]|uniref:GTP cyclohydrolase IIa n=1 Tax=Vulcanisaeta thermophila TaxID=867917 RepID=UPI0008534233|nr:GTP cyclohydrolase IIa [Vulcanisaeta thermophila]
MVQVTILRLIGYREWTETLGPDREHIIQGVQASLYNRLVSLFSGRNAWAHPFRYDYMFVISNGLRNEEIRELMRELREVSPVPISGGTHSHEEPRVAEQGAFKLSHLAGPWNVVGDEAGGDDLVCIAHIDLVNSTLGTIRNSSYWLYERVWSALGLVNNHVTSLGGLTFYLGGDNIVSVIKPIKNTDALMPLAKALNARIGVGIGRTGREAMKLATEALDELRVGGNGPLVRILENTQ